MDNPSAISFVEMKSFILHRIGYEYYGLKCIDAVKWERPYLINKNIKCDSDDSYIMLRFDYVETKGILSLSLIINGANIPTDNLSLKFILKNGEEITIKNFSKGIATGNGTTTFPFIISNELLNDMVDNTAVGKCKCSIEVGYLKCIESIFPQKKNDLLMIQDLMNVRYSDDIDTIKPYYKIYKQKEAEKNQEKQKQIQIKPQPKNNNVSSRLVLIIIVVLIICWTFKNC